ncbi:hypothetical protein DCAR_0105139 [Daucus carota subsp. sativus]|uniref:pyruvate kinase n=1 Tax=Daucus carota subsp. sativus TaxID=79200 RepID=A0AAF0WBV7_DAUCS|nr:hypothetical protein DCAR_0105139 [Daucus carota subsp. sativus]
MSIFIIPTFHLTFLIFLNFFLVSVSLPKLGLGMSMGSLWVRDRKFYSFPKICIDRFYLSKKKKDNQTFRLCTTSLILMCILGPLTFSYDFNLYHAPEVRSGALRQPLILLPGQEFTFTIRRGVGTTDCVSVNYDDFANDVDAGDMLLVDGKWYDALVVKCKDEDLVKCEVVDGSELKSRRHLNVRGESATLQSITYWDDIKFGVDNKIDFYAVSFVKDAEVVHELKAYLKILCCSFQAMVARGDLGVELPGDEVPSLQYGKSFYNGNKYVRNHDCSSTPKRAEVLDIAIAVKEGSDAVILSGETAHGKASLMPIKTDPSRNLAEPMEIVTIAVSLMQSCVASRRLKASGPGKCCKLPTMTVFLYLINTPYIHTQKLSFYDFKFLPVYPPFSLFISFGAEQNGNITIKSHIFITLMTNQPDLWNKSNLKRLFCRDLISLFFFDRSRILSFST